MPRILIRRLSKDTLIYGIGNIFSKGVALLLLPIYTRLFSPVEYGIIEMLSIITVFLSTVMMLGVGGAQNFFFFEQKKNGKQNQARVITSIFQLRLLWGGGILVIATTASPLLNVWLFDNELTWILFAAVFAGSWLFQTMLQSAEIFRLLFRPWSYLAITVSHSIGSAAIAIGLIIGLDMGLTGYFIGLCMGSLVAAIGGWWLVRDYIEWSRWHFDWWPHLLRFGAPLMLSSFAMIVQDSSDRLFIKYYLTFNDLGIYASSLKIATIVASVSGVFALSFAPFSQDLLHRSDIARTNRVLELILRHYGFFFLSLVIIIVAVAPSLVKLILPVNYYDSYRMIGILALSKVLLGFTYFSCLGSWKVKKTYLYSISVVVGTLVSIILNFFLVPAYGLVGAAMATAVGMLVLVMISFYLSHKSWTIGFDYLVLVLQVTICIVALVVIHGNYFSGESFGERALVVIPFLMVLTVVSVRRNEISKYKLLWENSSS